MTYTKGSKRIEQFEFASSNQHGDRFKETASKSISVVKLSAEKDDAGDLLRLILLSDQLDTPVRYDFDKHQAWINIVSNEQLRK